MPHELLTAWVSSAVSVIVCDNDQSFYKSFSISFRQVFKQRGILSSYAVLYRDTPTHLDCIVDTMQESARLCTHTLCIEPTDVAFA
jgi:hypothetical protein